MIQFLSTESPLPELKKARLINDVRYQDRTEMTLDGAVTFVKGHFFLYRNMLDLLPGKAFGLPGFCLGASRTNASLV